MACSRWGYTLVRASVTGLQSLWRRSARGRTGMATRVLAVLRVSSQDVRAPCVWNMVTIVDMETLGSGVDI